MSEDIKRKVSGWLREEGFFYEEVTDLDTYFNLSIRVAGIALDVVKDLHRDVVLVRSTLVFTQDQMAIFRKMSEKSQRDFLWEVRSRLLGNNEVGAFQIRPELENMEFFVQARGIFKDGLSKDRLLQSILVVHKSVTMILWLLEHQSGSLKYMADSSYM